MNNPRPMRHAHFRPARVMALMAALAVSNADAAPWLAPGDLTVRLGAVIWGIGLGWLYVAAKRNVIVPIVARMAFAIALVVLEGLQIL